MRKVNNNINCIVLFENERAGSDEQEIILGWPVFLNANSERIVSITLSFLIEI